MSRKLLAYVPGQIDINGQFTPANLPKTLAHLKKLLKGGLYEFGTLTAAYNGWAPGTSEYDDWMNEVATYPTTAQNVIRDAVVNALTHRKGSKDEPIPLTIVWNEKAPKGVTSSFEESATGPSWTVTINGYHAPAKSMLSERKSQNKK
jgi:hypothetical protein